MLIGLFKKRAKMAGEQKWFFISADVCGGGTRDKALRTSAWEVIVQLPE